MLFCQTLRHEATPTNEKMIEIVKFDGEHADAKLASHLYLHDSKKKEDKYLVCFSQLDTKVDMKALGKYLKAKNFRGGSEEDLSSILGCVKGGVNYFSMINDVDKKIKVIIDKQLAEAKWASFHPMDCTGSTAIKGEGILKLKELAGRDDASFEILDFT